MKNSEMMHLTLSRSDVIRIRQALADVALDYRREAQAPGTDEDRRQICERSAAMWFKLRDNVIAQFDLQDLSEEAQE